MDDFIYIAIADIVSEEVVASGQTEEEALQQLEKGVTDICECNQYELPHSFNELVEGGDVRMHRMRVTGSFSHSLTTHNYTS